MTSRRDFLLGRAADDTLEVSCEALFMRLVDARLAGGSADWRDRLERDFDRARRVRLRARGWMADADVQALLRPLISRVRARGGRVERD